MSTKVQFLYRHLNSRYYVRTFAAGKEKWTSLKTTLLSVAKNRMKEHPDAAERQKSAGKSALAMGKLTFGEVTGAYRRQLQASEVRPDTKAYREAGIKHWQTAPSKARTPDPTDPQPPAFGSPTGNPHRTRITDEGVFVLAGIQTMVVGRKRCPPNPGDAEGGRVRSCLLEPSAGFCCHGDCDA